MVAIASLPPVSGSDLPCSTSIGFAVQHVDNVPELVRVRRFSGNVLAVATVGRLQDEFVSHVRCDGVDNRHRAALARSNETGVQPLG
jgi:hypothetical protein